MRAETDIAAPELDSNRYRPLLHYLDKTGAASRRVYPVLPMALSFDHRVVTGWRAREIPDGRHSGFGKGGLRGA